MRHFVFEYITGGGLAGQDLPVSLIKEGDMMVNALVNDLLKLNQNTILLCRDIRLQHNMTGVNTFYLDEKLLKDVHKQVQSDDVVWLIAPEIDNSLYKLSQSFIEKGNIVFVSDLNTIQICSDKLLTYKCLKQNAINVVPTYLASEAIPDSEEGYIIKPRNGAGAEGLVFIKNKQLIKKYLEHKKTDFFIVQPYIIGKHLSISMLCLNGKAQLLACNKQIIEKNENKFSLSGIEINYCLDDVEELSFLANQIATSLPGLKGYIGVDLLRLEDVFMFVEINSRLTTSYVALSESLDLNVAELIWNVFKNQLHDVNIKNAKPIVISL